MIHAPLKMVKAAPHRWAATQQVGEVIKDRLKTGPHTASACGDAGKQVWVVRLAGTEEPPRVPFLQTFLLV